MLCSLGEKVKTFDDSFLLKREGMKILWGIPSDLSARSIDNPRGGHISNAILKEKLDSDLDIVNPYWANSDSKYLRYLGMIIRGILSRNIFLESSYILLSGLFVSSNVVCIVRDLNLIRTRHLKGILYTRALRNAKLIITNSEFMRNQIIQSIGQSTRIYVLYPDIGKYFSASEVNHSRNIGFIGSSSKDDKGYALLNSLAQSRPDLVINIYGKRNSRLLDLPNYKYCGYRPFEEIAKDCGILLIPSNWEEPFGRVALEALAARMDIIATRKGGLEEILPSCYLADNSVASFTKILDEILDGHHEVVSQIERDSILERFRPNYNGLIELLTGRC